MTNNYVDPNSKCLLRIPKNIGEHSSTHRKYIRPQNCARPQSCAFLNVFGPDLTRRIATCHRQKFGQVWGSTAPLPEVVRKLRSRKAPLWSFDYHMEKSESFCDVTPGLQAGHRKVRFMGFVWENRPKSENWATLKPRSSATQTSYRKVDRPRKLPTTWNKQHLSAVYPLTCSLLSSEVPV